MSVSNVARCSFPALLMGKIPPHMIADSPDGAMGEGVAVDAAGNIYSAEAQLRGVTKFVSK